MVSTQKPEAPNRSSGASSSSQSSSQHSDNKRPTSSSTSSTSETEKLSRAWRSLVSAVVVSTRAADKHSKQARGGGDATRHNKELEEAVDHTLRARNDFRRYVTAMEATLLGQAKETEALVGMLQSQPRMGRKRKKQEVLPENADPL